MHQRRYNTISQEARALKNVGVPLATRFTYKMRLGGNRDLDRGPPCTNKISLTLIFDKNLVQKLSILSSMDVDVILQLFKSVADNVQLVRGHHHILKIKMVIKLFHKICP
jgi:hypothetical protein